MSDLKQCPCKTCKRRQYFVRVFDMHFWGEDCPYQCDMYDTYKCHAEEGGKHEAD